MSRLPTSPTPRRVADAYAERIAEQATALAGKDGRLSANEASRSPEVADAYARAGKQRPVVQTVVTEARAAMLAEAERVSGGDGRVSKKDAAQMAPVFARAFEALRGAQPAPGGVLDGAALGRQFGALAEGLWHMSEGDDAYEAFSLRLSPQVALTAETLKALLTWDAEEGQVPDEYRSYPAAFELVVWARDDFWLREAEDLSPEEAAKHRALDRLMKSSFVDQAVPTAQGVEQGKVFIVTPRDDDAIRAPYYVVGRLENGDLAGLKTWRTWT